MPANSLKYNENLADYFSGKSLYLDEQFRKKPNNRKLVEQPWQQIKSNMLTRVINTLCNVDFIQAKSQARMTFELVRDYEAATKALLSGSDSLALEKKEWEQLECYAKALLEYAHPDALTAGTDHVTKLNLPVINSKMSLNAIQGYNKEIELLTEFRKFVRASANLLDEFCCIPDFCAQYIHNSMNAGALARVAEQAITNSVFNSPMLLRADVSRRKYEENPALTVCMQAYAEISSLALTTDGRRIISGDNRGTLRIWDSLTGECIKTINLTSPYYHVYRLAIGSDGQIAVTGPDTSDKIIRIWNLTSGQETAVSPLIGHKAGIESIAVTPDVRILASGSGDNTVRLWNVIEGSCIKSFDAGNRVSSVHISPDSRLLTALAKDTVFIWDTESGEIVKQINLGSFFNRSALSLDGKIAILSEANRLSVCNIETGTVRLLSELPANSYVNAIEITPDGAFAVCGCNDHIVRIYDIVKNAEIRNYRGHSQRVTALAFRADGKYVISGGSDGMICVWDTGCPSTPPIPPELSGKVRSLAIIRSQKVAMCQRDDGKIRFYQVNSGQDMTFFDSRQFIRWAISSTGRFCLSGTEKEISAWDMTTGIQYKFVVEEVPKDIHANNPVLTLMDLRVAAAGNRAITPGKDRVWVWDLKTGRCIRELPVPGELCVLAISADGNLAAAAGYQNRLDWDFGIRLWELNSGQLLHTFPQESSVKTLAFNPDCRSLVAGSSEGIMYIWHTLTGNILRMIGEKRSFIRRNNSLDIRDMHILQHGRKALVVSSDSITICDLKTAATDKSLAAGVNSGKTPMIEVTEDACYAISGSGSQTIRVWDLNLNKCIVLNAERSEIVHLRAAGDQIAIIDVDGEALFGTLKNIPQGPAILTALSVGAQPCPHCNALISTPDSVIEKITQSEKTVSIELSPALELPQESFEDPALLIKCEKCNHPIRFNPFLASSSLNSFKN